MRKGELLSGFAVEAAGSMNSEILCPIVPYAMLSKYEPRCKE
jgi:hypothetical protein